MPQRAVGGPDQGVEESTTKETTVKTEQTGRVESVGSKAGRRTTAAVKGSPSPRIFAGLSGLLGRIRGRVWIFASGDLNAFPFALQLFFFLFFLFKLFLPLVEFVVDPCQFALA